MGAGASTLRGDADPAAFAAAKRGFAPMDAPMVAVIAAGDLRLLKAAPLRDGSLCEFARLQDLEAARGEVFHPPADAAAAAYGRADDCYRLLLWGVDPCAVDRLGRYPSDVATVPWIRGYLRSCRRKKGYTAYAVV